MAESNCEHYKFAREILSKEIELRHDKQWKIFSWTSGIFVAIIGGLSVISGKGFTLLPIQQKLLLIFSISILAGFTFFWINGNRKRENKAREKAVEYDKSHGLELIASSPDTIGMGSLIMIILLAFAAICAVLTS